MHTTTDRRHNRSDFIPIHDPHCDEVRLMEIVPGRPQWAARYGPVVFLADNAADLEAAAVGLLTKLRRAQGITSTALAAVAVDELVVGDVVKLDAANGDGGWLAVEALVENDAGGIDVFTRREGDGREGRWAWVGTDAVQVRLPRAERCEGSALPSAAEAELLAERAGVAR